MSRFPGACKQEDLDAAVLLLLQNTKTSIQSIQSGGQTGIDEAGIKAALGKGLNCKINAPQGWMFRDRQGKDIKSERLFKARFQANAQS